MNGSFSTDTNTQAVVLGGALASIAVYAVETVAGLTIPATVATAAATVITGVLCYVLPARRGP